MRRTRLFARAAPALVLLLVAASTSAVRTAPQREGGSAREESAATYVGQDLCLACHTGQERILHTGPHARSSNPRTPVAAQGCESCHGPGSRHLEDPFRDDSIRKFSRMDTRAASDACQTCHNGRAQALWSGSTHDARDMGCTSCHRVHEPSPDTPLLRARSEAEACTACHRTQVMKTRRMAHMPVAEGRMTCSTCHNAHGATNVRLLRVGNWINESCVSCHTEKRGPFLFEHAAGRESCVSCHDPHGSATDRMLVARAPMLCQRCHIGTRHPSTLYDGTAVQARNARIVGRACINCHQQIHGSNHPSGQSLTR